MANSSPNSLPGEVWGPPLRGAAILLSTDNTQYKIGEPIRLRIRIRNNGKTELRLLSTDAVTTYRVTGFHEHGAPMQKSDLLERAESSTADPGAVSRSLKTLAAGQESVESFELQDLAKLEKPGAYYITVFRKLMSWDDGFLVSNTVRIKLTES